MFRRRPKKENNPFEEEYSEELGRYLIAKEDFQTGQLIYKESPLYLFAEFSDVPWNGEFMVCNSCYQEISVQSAVSCKYCKWLMCSKECTKSPCHRNVECGVFRKRKVKMTPETVRYLFLVRWFLTQKREKDKKKKMENLSSTVCANERNAGYFEELDIYAAEAMKFLKEICKISATEEEIKTFVNTLKVNAFAIVFKDVVSGETYEERCCAVYATSSLISHSCASNAEWTVSSHLSGRHMELYSRVPISKGEKITIQYRTDGTRMGMCERIENIYSQFGFVCKCERCLDPTELGTNYSTLKCPNCPEGLLHPHCTGSSNFDEHKCNACPLFVPKTEVAKIEGRFSGELEEISKWIDKKSRLEKLDDLISNATACYGLHTNHFLVQKATHEWLNTLDKDILLEDSEGSLKAYNSIMQRTNIVLDTLHAFGSDSKLRVQLEVAIVRDITQFHFKCENPDEIVQDITNVEKKVEIIRLILRHLRRGIKASRIYSLGYMKLAKEILERYNLWKARLANCTLQLAADDISLCSQDSSIAYLCSN